MRKRLFLALFALSTITIPMVTQAASVYGITGDDLQMNVLGEQYIHSRHTGLMPYWGPCYRCTTQTESEPSCTPGTQNHVLAQWTNAGNSSCGGYESDSFEAYTQCSSSGVVQIVLKNNSYDPGASVGQKNYGVTVPISVPQGGNYGQSLNMNKVFGGSNNCDQNFDWMPTYGITGEDVNGTFNGTVTFGNYLSPSQYEQSPTFPVVFQNYKLVSVRTCKQYAPSSTECQTSPLADQTQLPVYSWACNYAQLETLNGSQVVCSTTEKTSEKKECYAGYGTKQENECTTTDETTDKKECTTTNQTSYKKECSTKTPEVQQCSTTTGCVQQTVCSPSGIITSPYINEEIPNQGWDCFNSSGACPGPDGSCSGYSGLGASIPAVACPSGTTMWFGTGVGGSCGDPYWAQGIPPGQCETVTEPGTKTTCHNVAGTPVTTCHEVPVTTPEKTCHEVPITTPVQTCHEKTVEYPQTICHEVTVDTPQRVCQKVNRDTTGSAICSNSEISQSGAQWIFGANDGISGTNQTAYSIMQAQIDNPTGSPMPAQLAFGADNYGWVWINGSQVAFTEGYAQADTVAVTIAPGENTVTFAILNYPESSGTANPSKGILAITDNSGGTLLSTNNTDWTSVKSTPTTPNPTPQSLLPAGDTLHNCADGECG